MLYVYENELCISDFREATQITPQDPLSILKRCPPFKMTLNILFIKYWIENEKQAKSFQTNDMEKEIVFIYNIEIRDTKILMISYRLL